MLVIQPSANFEGDKGLLTSRCYRGRLWFWSGNSRKDIDSEICRAIAFFKVLLNSFFASSSESGRAKSLPFSNPRTHVKLLNLSYLFLQHNHQIRVGKLER